MKKLDIDKAEARRSNIEKPDMRRIISPKAVRTKRKFIVNTAIVIIICTSVAFAGYFYYKLRKLESNPSSTSKQEAEDLLSKVAKIYLIPQGEEPTIATVSDPSKLKDQTFFADSQKGDKVLIFTTAGKAILYRPSINKIIEIAPINISKDNQKNATPPEATPTPLKDKTF